MSHPRAIDDTTAATLERWYSELECLGTVAAKCRELGISKPTFYDTIARVRGKDTQTMKTKLNGLRELATALHETALHVEQSSKRIQPLPTVKEEKETPNND